MNPLIRIIFILSASSLVIATSCVRTGPYYSLEHEIQCPPDEYHFPLVANAKGYKIQLADQMERYCSGLPFFIVENEKNDQEATLFAKILRTPGNCKLVVAFTTYKHDKNGIKEKNLKAAHAFPEIVGLKPTGKVNEAKGESDEDGIQKWCSLKTN